MTVEEKQLRDWLARVVVLSNVIGWMGATFFGAWLVAVWETGVSPAAERLLSAAIGLSLGLGGGTAVLFAVAYRPWVDWKRERKRRKRITIAVDRWNASLDFITGEIAKSDDDNCWFKWKQLVWQEIVMWISLGESVKKDEFEWMCNRRGFDQTMRKFLSEMLQEVGLKKF